LAAGCEEGLRRLDGEHENEAVQPEIRWQIDHPESNSTVFAVPEPTLPRANNAEIGFTAAGIQVHREAKTKEPTDGSPLRAS